MEKEKENDILKDFMTKLKDLVYSKNLKISILILTVLLGFFSKKAVVNAKENCNVLYSDQTKKEYNLSCENFDKGELECVTSINYTIIDETSSFDWVKYFPNINDLTITFATTDNSILKDIDKIKELKKLDNLHLKTDCNISITNENFSFLRDCLELKNLDIDGLSIEEGVLESLNNLEKLSLNSFRRISNVIDTDYSKLTFLKELNFKSSRPYDIPIYFSLDDYKILTLNGVSVTSEVDGCIDKVVEVNMELDHIVQQLNIDSDDSEIDKFNKVLVYILDSLEYDDDVSLATKVEQDNLKELASGFYSDGLLYGALNGDSAICGNYAALFAALSNRVGLHSYYLSNNKHAWNLVEINGENYFTDATWMDDASLRIDYYGFPSSCSKIIDAQTIIDRELTDYLDWYMVDPSNFESLDYDEEHVASNLPSYVNIVPVSSDSVIEKFEFSAGAKRKLAVFLIACSSIAIIKRNRDKKRRAIFEKYLRLIKNHEYNLEDNDSLKKKNLVYKKMK